MFRARSIALLLAVVFPVSLSAQVPNLSGTWVLQVNESDFGMVPAPTSRTDVIEHTEPGLTIKRSQVTSQGPANVEMVYAVDGKAWKNTMSDGSELSSTLRWDGAVLVITSTINTPNGEAIVTDRLSLSQDGRTLTQDRVIAVAGQEIAQRMLLVKQ